MKGLLKSYLVFLIALYVTTQIVKGFTYFGGIKTLLVGAAVFSIINWFIKPIIKILMLPFNLITLGLFSWMVNVLMIFLLTKFVPQLIVKSWNFQGITIEGYSLPALEFNVLMTFVAASFVIAFATELLNWLIRK